MSKNPVSKCCKAPAKIIIGEGISFWECTQCKMSCDTVESEEPKVCECYQTVNGKVHCALHCPNGYDHSKLNPAPSLNNWEEQLKIIINKWIFRLNGFGDITLPKNREGFLVFECPELEPFVASQITLAIQKERADHFVDANKLIEDAVQKERKRITKAINRVEHIYRPQKEKWYIEQKGMLNIISNKGVEEK